MRPLLLLLLVILGSTVYLSAQQQVTIVSPCGGWDTISIPQIIDNDLDGMDDGLEQQLLDNFMPYIVQYVSDNCPGPNTDGTGDTNLVVSRIFPIPQQYTSTSNIDSVKLHPAPIVPAHGLTIGLVWYNTIVKINSALLYGKDCGLIGHTADVEGFNFSVKYTGTLPAGWMYDTNMQNWAGVTIQTISHAGTLCEAVETQPYRSAANPMGKDTIYPSPDKHGSYLTVSQCSSNIICDPSCSGAFTRHKVKNINLGEPNAPLVSDLGTIYAPYAGEDPWGTNDFLSGGAGTVASKMNLDLNTTFVVGSALSSQTMICNRYTQCYGMAGSAIFAYTCKGTPYHFYNQQLDSSGTYSETFITPYGCDSTVTLTLLVAQPDTVDLFSAICDGQSYSFNGQQLDSSGIYQVHLFNSFGCDSTVTLELLVDSVIKLNLNAEICDGDNFPFQGQNLTTTGIYVDTLTATGGCDSIVVMHLQVKPSPGKPMINSSGSQLSTDTAGISSFQWYFNSLPIPAANFASLTAAANGYYQVLVSNSAGCNALSDSILITGVGIPSIEALNFDVFPNPTHNKLFVQLNKQPVNAILNIYNVSGDRVLARSLNSELTNIDVSQLPAGIYLLTIFNSGNLQTQRFIKE